MSARDGLDRLIAGWMAEVTSSPAPAAPFDETMAATARRRPRPRWLAALGSDWVGTARRPRVEWGTGRTVVPVVYVIVVLGLILAFVVGAIAVGGPTTRRPRGLSATPVRLPVDGALAAGTYSLGPSFPASITFEVGPGWSVCSLGVVELGVCRPLPGGQEVGVGFLIVDNVVADPCGLGEQLLDPPVGPSVEDLVTGISNLQGFQATIATDINVDGFAGRQFTVTAPANSGCALKTWATRDRANGVSDGEVNVMRILEVDGVRVVISGAYHPVQASEPVPSVLEQVIASVHIDRSPVE